MNAAALVTFTMVLRNLAIPPTPFSTEVFFLSEAALAQTDPFCILPAAIGTMAMLNTEIRRALLPAPVDGAADQGRFMRAVDSLARGFSVLIVSFAMTNPIVRTRSTGREQILTSFRLQAVQIYWMTSFIFTSFESVITTRLERRRTEALEQSQPLEPTKAPATAQQSAPKYRSTINKRR